MHSLRTKITMLTICVTVIAVSVVTLLGVLFIRNNARRRSDQLLLLLCETGDHNLDFYFNSVEKSVRKVAKYIEQDLAGLPDDQFEAHMDRAAAYFDEVANKTNGVLTYYYRVDPEYSDKVSGFWYTDVNGEGFEPHEVTDITLYDTKDTSGLVWFTVPKNTGDPIWLPPYITDNLEMRVISYNVPIYRRGQFVGVAGIEIDYSTMAEQVESIRLYNNGYAFLCDADGHLFFHPRIDVTQLTPETMPPVPEGLVSDSTFIHYTYDGVDKQAAWLPLSNGMRLVVTVPRSETEGDWQRLIFNILIASLEVLIVLCIISLIFAKRITEPLQELTEAAEQVDMGNYNFTLTYDGNDEVGRLTRTFRRLADHMRDHISDLNSRVYVDALTHVKNKGAFSDAVEELQKSMDTDRVNLEFGIGVFDCDDLKTINDVYGHDKGDIYLKTASQLICRVFQHSPVYRIGGDEFSVILRGDDYMNREHLLRQFEQRREEINAATPNQWEQVRIAVGVAVYDPATDGSVIDVVRRGDKSMYANKRANKEKRG